MSSIKEDITIDLSSPVQYGMFYNMCRFYIYMYDSVTTVICTMHVQSDLAYPDSVLHSDFGFKTYRD